MTKGMVYLVKKKKGRQVYLYLQKSVHLPGTRKKMTEYVAYLGNEKNFTKADLKKILEKANR